VLVPPTSTPIRTRDAIVLIRSGPWRMHDRRSQPQNAVRSNCSRCGKFCEREPRSASGLHRHWKIFDHSDKMLVGYSMREVAAATAVLGCILRRDSFTAVLTPASGIETES
jgi:hypothetical protein